SHLGRLLSSRSAVGSPRIENNRGVAGMGRRCRLIGEDAGCVLVRPGWMTGPTWQRDTRREEFASNLPEAARKVYAESALDFHPSGGCMSRWNRLFSYCCLGLLIGLPGVLAAPAVALMAPHVMAPAPAADL